MCKKDQQLFYENESGLYQILQYHLPGLFSRHYYIDLEVSKSFVLDFEFLLRQYCACDIARIDLVFGRLQLCVGHTPKLSRLEIGFHQDR